MSEDMAVIRSVIGFPYFLLRKEISTGYNLYTQEVAKIKQAYVSYNEGSRFTTEGSAGDYVPSQTKYKKAKYLIDKEARFMFSQTPDIKVTAYDLDDANTKLAEQYQRIVDKVLEKSNFSSNLLKAANDCFIGGRVACLVDYSTTDGAMVHFYSALQFYYETDYGSDKLTKFVSFETLNDTKSESKRLYLVNRYELIDNIVYMSSILYDGRGVVVETIIAEHATELKYIPAVVIINDGTLEQKRGVSEIEELTGYESTYSKLSNADVDSERKGMNPVRFVVDMNSKTTKNLSSGAGAFWEMKSEQNQNVVHPQVGTLAPLMNHTEAVKTTLDRINTAMHDAVDVPDISADGLLQGITSFKALKALYYPLSVRCNEKLKTWKPAIKFIVDTILDFAFMNKTDAMSRYAVSSLDETDFVVNVVENYALLDDENEEKDTDLTEIAHNTRSRKSYMKKWRSDELKTDAQINAEILQIAYENNLFDAMAANPELMTEISRRGTSAEITELLAQMSAGDSLQDM